MLAAADAQTPVACPRCAAACSRSAAARRRPAAAGPPFSSRSTSAERAAQVAVRRRRRSWSYLMPCWPLRSMWKSLPCHSAWAMPCGEVQAGHLLVADLGVEPDQLGRAPASSMNASACPMVGSRMSPRGSLGLGSIANRMS